MGRDFFRGCVPPAFELPPITPQCDTPELSDPRCEEDLLKMVHMGI